MAGTPVTSLGIDGCRRWDAFICWRLVLYPVVRSGGCPPGHS